MRIRFTRWLAAVAMAVTITVPIGARPASAVINWAVVTEVVKQAYGLYKDYQGNRLTLADATQRIINKIDSAKVEILTHIDQIAVADVRTCSRAAVIDFIDIERMSADTLQAFARDTTACVVRAESLIGTVTDPGSVDTIGTALNAVGPIALTARARVGWETSSLLAATVTANQTVVTRLTPECRTIVIREPGAPVERWYRCTGYNGNSAEAFRATSPSEQEQVKDEATANTSRRIAKAVLPVLQA